MAGHEPEPTPQNRSRPSIVLAVLRSRLWRCAMEKITQLVPVGAGDGYPKAFYGLDVNGNIWYGEVIPGAPMAIRWGRVDEQHD
jgi:hypothetical protein